MTTARAAAGRVVCDEVGRRNQIQRPSLAVSARLALVLTGLLLAGCASTTIAGTAESPSGAGPDDIGPPYVSTCEVQPSTPQPGETVPTPTGSPLITITQGTNAWIATRTTQPYAIAIYPDGTAIRTEDVGTASDPLPELKIGRLDPCRLAEAMAGFGELARSDLGDAQVTDQGTTTVTVHDPAGDTVVEVYALGIGDEYMTDEQRAARERLSALIDDLRDGMTQTGPWTPDRIRVSLIGNPVDTSTELTWPLPGTIDQDLQPQEGGPPCSVFDGAEAEAILTELGSESAGSSWRDETQTVVLAIGVLVPGQGCASG